MHCNFDKRLLTGRGTFFGHQSWIRLCFHGRRVDPFGYVQRYSDAHILWSLRTAHVLLGPDQRDPLYSQRSWLHERKPAYSIIEFSGQRNWTELKRAREAAVLFCFYNRAQSKSASFAASALLVRLLAMRAFLAYGCAMLAAVSATTPESKSIAAKLEARYRGAHTLQATFLERYSESGQVVRSEAGIAYFRRPGKMRWEYELSLIHI